MERPGGVPHYRYGPGASYREGLEHNLIETIFEDRTALEAVMKDFIGSHGKIAGLITSTLRLFQRDVHTILGRSSDISRLDGEADESLQDAINRTFEHLMDEEFEGTGDDGDEPTDTDLTTDPRTGQLSRKHTTT